MRILYALIIFLLPLSGFCSPFLVCDRPSDDEEVVSYTIYADGVVIATVPIEESEYGLKYDLQNLGPGKITFTATATNIRGMSAPSDPFVLPAAPSIPAGMKLVP